VKPAVLRNLPRPVRKTVRRSGKWAAIKDSLTDVRREFPFKMYLNLFSKIAVGA